MAGPGWWRAGRGTMPLAVQRVLAAARGQGVRPAAGLVQGWLVEPVAEADAAGLGLGRGACGAGAGVGAGALAGDRDDLGGCGGGAVSRGGAARA